MALNNVPLSGQSLNQTRNAINQNFTSYINNQFAVDHQEFATTNAGKHLKVSLLAPADSTIPPVTANGFVIFPAQPNTAFNVLGVAEYPVTVANEYINIRNAGQIKICPMNLAGGVSLTNGFTFLPSGVVLKWGLVNIANSATTTVTFDTDPAIPVYSFIFTVLINPILTPGQNFLTQTGSIPAVQTPYIIPYVTQATPTSFDVLCPATSDSNNISITYLAIGTIY